MMNRIEKRMALLKQNGEKAFITYITAGFPDLEKTKELIRVQEEAGVDVIELGIPFSDPVADGPVIQSASYESIQHGTTLTKVLELMREVRAEGIQVPVVFMMYYNTAYHYGLERFVDACADCGVDGLIIPDLPFEEQGELREAVRMRQDAPILIQLVSPVSGQRIPKLLEGARGFVYCVSQMGVTGGERFHNDVRSYLEQVRAVSEIPLMMGFGIKEASDVRPFQDLIDGAIVGSHLIHLLRESDFSADSVQKYAAVFRKELNA